MSVNFTYTYHKNSKLISYCNLLNLYVPVGKLETMKSFINFEITAKTLEHCSKACNNDLEINSSTNLKIASP